MLQADRTRTAESALRGLNNLVNAINGTFGGDKGEAQYRAWIEELQAMGESEE